MSAETKEVGQQYVNQWQLRCHTTREKQTKEQQCEIRQQQNTEDDVFSVPTVDRMFTTTPLSDHVQDHMPSRLHQPQRVGADAKIHRLLLFLFLYFLVRRCFFFALREPHFVPAGGLSALFKSESDPKSVFRVQGCLRLRV